jgi:hypothetical protein
MSLTKTINKSIEKSIISFTQEVAQKYGVSQDDLLEIWSNISKMKMKTIDKKKKKLSPWLKFCKDERIRIKKEDSSIPFGQISKMIGDLWKNMSDEDKKNYGQDEDVSTDTEVEADDDQSITSIDNWTENDLKKMKISKLRSLCENVQLSKTGKKEVLIDRLLKCKKMSHHDNDNDDSSCDFNNDED